MREHYEILCCQHADEVIVISESLREYLILKGIAAEKITVLPNGVDSEILSPIEKSDDIIERYQLDNSIVLGFVGSITNYEGIDLIIDTVETLNNSDYKKRFKLLLVGDGQYRATLQGKVLNQNLSEDIIFTRQDLPFETVKRLLFCN